MGELILNKTEIQPETLVELMEVRRNEYHRGYKDYFLRIDGTSDALVIRGIGFDPDYIRVWFSQNYFDDGIGYRNRCDRLAKKYKLDFEFVYAFSDSAEVISDFLKRMKKIKIKMSNEYRKALLRSNSDTKRDLLKRVLGEDISKRARIRTKNEEQVEKVAEFVANF